LAPSSSAGVGSTCAACFIAKGLDVNAVSPGWIWTPEVERAAVGDRDGREAAWSRFHMLRRLGEPREVARAILFLSVARMPHLSLQPN
jgi:NAD(P)-dependent dehydrogenase (short-subunit alcohol dehydrogenase family)